MRASTEVFDLSMLEKLDREQLIKLLINANKIIFELTGRVSDLEARLSMNSSNSSKPPSSDGYVKPAPKSLRKKSGKKPGGQHKHKGAGVSMADKVTETILLTPKLCSCCGENLESIPGRKKDTRFLAEMPPIEIKVTKFIREEKTCPKCHEVVFEDFPNEVAATHQYGPNLKSFIVLLSVTGLVAMNRIVEIVEAISGLKISTGTVANTISNCASLLEKHIQKIKEALIKAKVVHFDETGMRSQNKLKWLYVHSTQFLTFFKIHHRRSKKAMEAIGVLTDFKGISVHDCLKAYFNFTCKHALCNAHLLRELVFICEKTGQNWADKMIKLLLEIKKNVDERKLNNEKSLPDTELAKYMKRYDKLVKKGLKSNPEQKKSADSPAYTIQKKAHALVKRLQDRKIEYLLFASNFDVPFDNNQAERDIRMAKVKQKVSGSFRSSIGEKSFPIIFSFISTLKKNKVHAFHELIKVFKGDYSFPFSMGTE